MTVFWILLGATAIPLVLFGAFLKITGRGNARRDV